MVDAVPNGRPIPDKATDAVLKPSAPMSPNARVVRGVEFNEHTKTPLTVEALVEKMATTGFQASAVSDAVRIVNDMVCPDIANGLSVPLLN